MIYQFKNKARIRNGRNATTLEGEERCRGLRQWAAAGVIALVVSFAFPLVIDLLVQRGGGIEQASSLLHTLSTISVVLIIPLLVIGSYCLNVAVDRSLPEPPVCSPRQLSFSVTSEGEHAYPASSTLSFHSIRKKARHFEQHGPSRKRVGARHN
jgi:hypothetical protein